MTITPVLCYYLSPKMKHIDHGDSALVKKLKAWDERLLNWSFDRGRLLLAGAAITVALALASIPFFPKSSLPPFNEGTLTVSVLLNPGTSPSEANRLGTQAEKLLLTVPEVAEVGRRTGRAELDEHAEGVHSSEIEVDLKASERGREVIIADIRQRLSGLPAVVSVGQPISHRLDHLLSGVRAQIALKMFGDVDTLRGLAGDLRKRLARIPGITDLQIEKQVLIPQYKIRVDYAAARYGVTSGELLQRRERLLAGERLGQVLEGNRRFDLSLRLPEDARGERGLENLLIETPIGRVPLSSLATIEDGDGPNQIGRENTRRRIVISANSDGSDMSRIIADLRAEIDRQPMPEGYFPLLEGQFQAHEEAARLIAVLALVSLAMIYLVLYSRYRSAVLTAIVMGNVPLVLVGSVVALWVSGQPLSVAALVGFVTLTGIATRNGILKISHYINLCAFEDEVFGRKRIVRGSLERLTPVLMTALVAAFALTPLLNGCATSANSLFAEVAAHRFAQTPMRSFAATGSLVVAAFYMIAQMVGAGQLIKVLFGLDYVVAVILVGVLTMCYVLFVGMTATTWVQIIKAIMLLSGATFLALAVLWQFGFNPEALFSKAVEVHAKHDAIMAPGALIKDPISAISVGMALMFGTAGLPHILMRFFTVPNAKEARKSVGWATTWIGYFYILTFIIGFGAIVNLVQQPDLYFVDGDLAKGLRGDPRRRGRPDALGRFGGIARPVRDGLQARQRRFRCRTAGVENHHDLPGNLRGLPRYCLRKGERGVHGDARLCRRLFGQLPGPVHVRTLERLYDQGRRRGGNRRSGLFGRVDRPLGFGLGSGAEVSERQRAVPVLVAGAVLDDRGLRRDLYRLEDGQQPSGADRTFALSGAEGPLGNRHRRTDSWRLSGLPADLTNGPGRDPRAVPAFAASHRAPRGARRLQTTGKSPRTSRRQPGQYAPLSTAGHEERSVPDPHHSAAHFRRNILKEDDVAARVLDHRAIARSPFAFRFGGRRRRGACRWRERRVQLGCFEGEHCAG